MRKSRVWLQYPLHKYGTLSRNPLFLVLGCDRERCCSVRAMQRSKLLCRVAISPWGLLLFILATSHGANLSPQWGIVGSSDVSGVESVSDGIWAHVPGAIVNGTQLVPGIANLQENWAACAASCGTTSECNAFNFCGSEPTCIADSSGQRVPFGACQLLYQEEAAEGRGVTQLAGGNAQLGDAGVKMLIERPTSIPKGYDMVYGESFIYGYDISCNGTWTPGLCMLTDPLPDLISRCDAWEQCQMIVVGPKGWGDYKDIPYGWLKGWANSSWAPIDLKKGNLNPTTYLLIKKGQWLGSVPEQSSGGGGGLSAGVVAGIVVAATAAACALATGTFFVLRRRRHRQRFPTGGNKDVEAGRSGASGTGTVAVMQISSASKAISTADSQMDEVVAAFSRPGQGAGNFGGTEKLVARLLADAPSPQWADVIVPRHQVQFVLKDGRPVRLGTGSSGTVYRGVLNAASPCAIKVYDFQEDEKLARYFIQEAVVLRKLRHPNIIQFLGVSVTEGRGLLLMELMAGDLWKAMRADTGEGGARNYGWYKRGRHVALQIASGLSYLHSQHLVHLDLKSANILISQNRVAKLGDVGFTRMLHKTHVSGLDGRIGTFTWCAPEVLLGGRAGQPADIYSLGIIIWELCTGEQPVRGCMAPLRSPEQCPPEVARLHAACVQQDPAARPTAAEIVRVLKAAASSAAAMAAPAAGPPSHASTSAGAPSHESSGAGVPSHDSSSTGAAVGAATGPSSGAAATCPGSGAQGACCPGVGGARASPPGSVSAAGACLNEDGGVAEQEQQEQGSAAMWRTLAQQNDARCAPQLSMQSSHSMPTQGDLVVVDPVSSDLSGSTEGWEAEAASLSKRKVRGVEVRHVQPMAKSPFAAMG